MATHLAASMRAVAAYQHRRPVTAADARGEVMQAAQRTAEGVAGPETEKPVRLLKRSIGATLAGLVTLAQE